MHHELEARFNFHPVGQGCFYTGSIRVTHKFYKEFNFVYDCGADRNDKHRYLFNAIERFRKYNGDTIDMVILSHFDWDHVSGVVQLLKGITCRRLVIPYYEIMERLLLYMTSENQNADYLTMLRDPVNFFGGDERFNISEIIVVGGGGAAVNITRSPEGGDLPLRNLMSMEEFMESRLEGFEFTDELQPENSSEKKIPAEFINRTEKSYLKLKFMQTPYRITIGIWEFYFYHLPS